MWIFQPTQRLIGDLEACGLRTVNIDALHVTVGIAFRACPNSVQIAETSTMVHKVALHHPQCHLLQLQASGVAG